MKKILRFILAIALVFVWTTVDIKDVTAAMETLYEWQYYLENASDNQSAIYPNSDNTGIKFYGAANDIEYYSNGAGISDTPVFNITSNYFVAWLKRGIDVSSKPVVNFSFQVYIPTGKENITREIQVGFAKQDIDQTGEEQYNNANYGQISYYLSKASDQAIGYSSSNQANVSTTMLTSGLKLEADAWHQINIRAYTNNNRLSYAMYVDDCLSVISNSTSDTVSADDFGIQRIVFNFNKGDTYIKDLKLCIEDYHPVYEPMKPLSNVPFSGMSTNEAGALSAVCYGELNWVSLQSSTASTEHYYNQNSKSYQNIEYLKENNALKIVLTPSKEKEERHTIIQNFQRDLTSRFSDGETKYLQMSYDVKIPAGTESSSRNQRWSISNDSATKTTTYTINSEIKNGEARFYLNDFSEGKMTNVKRLSCSIQSDKWYRVIYLIKITAEENQYLMHTEGYLEDIAEGKIYQAYESDYIMPGASFYLLRQQMDVVTPSVQQDTNIATYYDNVKSNIFDINCSELYPGKVSIDENLYSNGLTLEWDRESKTARAQGKLIDSSIPRVIIAGYDEKNALVAFAISNLENDESTVIDSAWGNIELSASFNNEREIVKLKAFMFENLTTLIPLTKSVEDNDIAGEQS